MTDEKYLETLKEHKRCFLDDLESKQKHLEDLQEEVKASEADIQMYVFSINSITAEIDRVNQKIEEAKLNESR